MSTEQWLALDCPLCKSKLRIKSAYAHLRGRCPECGGRVEAPRPRPQAPRRISDADEPQGLVPIDEEWPESAQLADEDDRKEYGVAPTPTSWPDAVPPPAKPMVEGYHLDRQGWRPEPAAPVDPTVDPYQVAPVDNTAPPPTSPILYSLTLAELNPIRVGPPPRFPLWQGVFSFPFRLECIKPWLYIGVGLTVVDGLALMVHGCIVLIMQENKIGAIVPLPLMALMFFLLLVGSYAASCFMAAVQDTAAGNDTVRWTDDSIMERFFKFYYLLWLVACAALPMGLFLVIQRGEAVHGSAGPILLLITLWIFPVLLLSSLSAHSMWIILDKKLLGRLLRHPSSWVLLFVYPPVLLVPNAWLIYASVGRIEMGMVPVAGLVCAGSILLYARMIGRAGWIMTKPGRKAPKGDRRTDKERAPSAEEETAPSDGRGWG